MERAEFEERVRAFERVAERSPRLYVARIFGFVLLGFGVYALVVVLTLAVLAAVVTVCVLFPKIALIKFGWKIGLVLVAIVYGLVAALKVEWHAPSGVPLVRKDAPRLFEMLDEFSRRLAVKKLDGVFLSDDYNASVLQTPRFGLFGTRNYLTLGMPLLQAHSVRDVRAIVGHEFGHLSGNHSRFSAWIYQVVRTYDQALEQAGDNAFLERFLGWYVPRVEAATFPLRRRNEYEADRRSAEVTSPAEAAGALIASSVRAAELGPFWKAVHRNVLASVHPPATLFVDWERQVAVQPSDTAAGALGRALLEETGTLDTHPALRDRLRALGTEAQDARVEPFPDETAARAFFEERYDYFVSQVGLFWSSQVHEGWAEAHREVAKKRARLAQLEEKRSTATLEAEETFLYADLAEDLFPERDPLPLFRAALEVHPDFAPTRFAVARLLLARDDASGVPLMLEFAEAEEAALRGLARALLAAYETRRGQASAAA